MKVIEMAKICHNCQFYRSVSYASGESSIGCLKAAGLDGRPKDIRNVAACPLGHGARKEPIMLANELLQPLGKIYAMTAPAAAHISLYKLLSEYGKSIDKYRVEVSLALQQMVILNLVAKSVPGQRGRRCVYRWDMKKHGPPSLELADKIIMQVEQIVLAEKLAKRRMVSVLDEGVATYNIEVKEGVTKCETCWLKELNNCRAQLMSFGIDCKKMNINTMKHEAGLGFKEDSAEG